MRRNRDIKAMVDAFEMKAMADAFVDSTNRSRFIFIIMIILSFLTFLAVWNAQPESWINFRLRTAKYASRHWDLLNSDSWFHAKIDSLTTWAEVDSLESAYFFCKGKPITDQATLGQYIENLERLRAERILMLPVSTYGVMIDVNDLGVFGGLAFTLILFWCWFNLGKESTNLKMIFDKARETNQLITCYKYLAMRQMLTAPRIPYKPSLRFLSHGAKSLYCLPLMVQTSIVLPHLRSVIGIGEKGLVQRVLMGDLISLSIISFITIKCFCLTFAIDKEWDDAYEEIKGRR